MFSRKAPPAPVPSTTFAPSLLPKTLPKGPRHPVDMTLVSSRDSSVEIVRSTAHVPIETAKSAVFVSSVDVPSSSKSKRLVDQLKSLAKHLCNDISRRALPTFKPDPLACYDVDPAGYDDKSLSADELWEEVLNSVMKNGLGWGTTFDVPSLLETSGHGMLGLTRFVEYFIVERGVSEALFEGKLTHLMSGLDDM